MQVFRKLRKLDPRWLHSLLAPLMVIALVWLFYSVENWRGRHAWLNFKRQLEAKGLRVDWTNYTPAAVSEDENFYGVPEMQRWLVGRGGNDLSSGIDSARNRFLAEYVGEVMARVTVVKNWSELPAQSADVLLDYSPELGAATLCGPDSLKKERTAPAIIPLVVMDQVILKD